MYDNPHIYIDRITSTYEHQTSDKNEEAEHRCDIFAFHMSEAHQIYCENNLQKKVPTLFSRKGGLYEQVTFLACDSRYSRRRMKESIFMVDE